MRLKLPFGPLVLMFLCLWLPKSIFSLRTCTKTEKKDVKRETLQDRKHGELRLLDDIFEAVIIPKLNKSIFFHVTGPFEKDGYNFADLSPHKACSVESAAKLNPNSTIFVLYALPAYWPTENDFDIMHAVLSYPNVQLRNIELWDYAKHTPIYDWFRTYDLFESEYMTVHISDLLRLITLWRYGGTVVDFNLMLLGSLEGLPHNFAITQEDGRVNTGILNFASDGIGHVTAEFALKEFETNFNPQAVKNNGPNCLTRVFLYFCGTNELNEIFNSTLCQGLKVYAPYTFCAISWTEWNHFSNIQNAPNITNKLLNNTCIANIFSGLYENTTIGSLEAYGILARRNCPKVYAAVQKSIKSLYGN